jgi:protein-L-isoaspartate(D-aspartate) O-methyltransferase
MERVPRHLFVPESRRSCSYDDGPLPIGLGQTISQPYMVARMTELLGLTPASKVLEIGTGSGYQAAVLAELAGEVWSVERLSELASRAESLLRSLGYTNVQVVAGDGTLGFSEAAPYDAIIVTAAAPHVPQGLRVQLATGGRMVIPVAADYSEDLMLIERLRDDPAIGGVASLPLAGTPSPPQGGSGPCFRETCVLKCVFVPLVGEDGYRG